MPDPTRYDPRVALLVVDFQNDFADPAGSLAVAGADVLLPRLNAEIDAAEASGALVVLTQDWHPPATPHFAKDGGIWPVHCVAGSWGAELHPALRVPADAPRVRKGSHGEDGYSAFTMRDAVTGDETPTELNGVLEAHGVRAVVVVGLATDYCVRASALDAVRLGYAVRLLSDAVAAVDLQPGDGERAISEMAGAGVSIE